MTTGKQLTIKQHYDPLEKTWLKYASTQAANLVLWKGRGNLVTFSLKS
jgi:hypothetical protein